MIMIAKTFINSDAFDYQQLNVALNSAPAYFTTQLLFQHEQLLEKFTETEKNGHQFKKERVKYKIKY